MTTDKTVVADAVSSAFSLSASSVENISAAAEMAMDATYDFSKACDIVAGEMRVLKSANALTFVAFETIREQFEKVATVRARDNKAADPETAANACWGRVYRRNKDIHGLVKPKSEKAGSEEKQKQREAEKAKLVEVAAGRSVAELEDAKRALYSQADDESIAKAKALEKAIKVVKTAEDTAIKSQIKPMVESATAKHKAILDLLKSDPKRMGDYVVLLAKTYDIWVEQLKA